ncbi:MAG TPA: hypothetical protein VFJ57_15570 [Solirubrobacterales bacterium]|nr:hypothetical protein [Solirubrobacterales bacterium]
MIAAYTFPDWLTIVGFPLALLGIFLGLAQLVSANSNAAASKIAAEAAQDAAEAARSAIEKTQRNLADNHLLMLLLQIENLISELGYVATLASGPDAGDGTSRRLLDDRGRQLLDEWIGVGSQLQTFLDHDHEDEKDLIDALGASALVAGAAKGRLGDFTFDEATEELRKLTISVEIGCAKVLGKMRAFVREGPAR